MPLHNSQIDMSEIGGQDSAGELDVYLRDRLTSAFPTIPTEHSFIHEGDAFCLSGTVTVTGSHTMTVLTASAEYGYIHFTPAQFSVSGGPVTVFLYEDTTASAVTGTMTPYNLNRNVADTSTTVWHSGVSATVDGTAILHLLLPGATQGNQRLGSGGGVYSERVLAPNKRYAIKLFETGSGSIVAGYEFTWYEEPSGY